MAGDAKAWWGVGAFMAKLLCDVPVTIAGVKDPLTGSGALVIG